MVFQFLNDFFVDEFNIRNFFNILISFLFYRTPLEVDQVKIVDATGFNAVDPFIHPVAFAADSYSVGDRCYCHPLHGFVREIGRRAIETPRGTMTVEEACAIIGPGPGSIGRPFYNDIQCGNGPMGLADEDPSICAGRVDRGRGGCGVIGPKWVWDDVVAN